MRFEELSRSFQTGSARDRGNASLEYKVLSGPFLGVGHNAQETVLTLRGNGSLEFFRRGDFAERGDRPPGLWRSRCGAAEMEEAWRLLGGLRRDSFPPKPDDPGDAVTMLNAYFPNAFVSLTWGATENGMDSPAERFIACMEALTVKALSERPEWAVELQCRAGSFGRGRLELEATFRNPGRSPVGLFIPGRENIGGFTLRYADVRDVPEASTGTPFPEASWSKSHAVSAEAGEDRLCSLAAGGEVSLRLEADISPPEGGSRLGKLQYEQLGHLDFLAGNRILSGECFSAPFPISPS